MQVRDSVRKETLIYAVAWLVLLAAPLMSIAIHQANQGTGGSFSWHELLAIWKQYAIFLAAFLLHNFLLAPLLVCRGRRLLYLGGVAALLALFVCVQCANRPDAPHPHEPHVTEAPMHDGLGAPPPHELGRHRPPVIVGEHDVVATIIFILMLGVNLGVKSYFRQQQDRQKMALLEHQNLEQQLEYLKYQINPHFLMNTLNNIHALIDIEPEQAKETIVELSKIMRFVLYEGSRQTVPLRQEIIFLENYIGLMRMRVAEQVSISVSMPDMIPDREIPPLMLITFVENAFKHGVSYQQPSFIDITIDIVDAHLHFVCRNSKIPQSEDRHGGVGLQNVRRRLQLIYGNAYTLDISDLTDTYNVELILPL